MKNNAVRKGRENTSFFTIMWRIMAIFFCVMMIGGLSSHCAAAAEATTDVVEMAAGTTADGIVDLKKIDTVRQGGSVFSARRGTKYGKITVEVSPAEGGTVELLEHSMGIFFFNAVPNENYVFLGWTASNGSVTEYFDAEKNPLPWPDGSVITITANFQKVLNIYEITSSQNKGHLKVESDAHRGYFTTGDHITITAYPNNGYRLVSIKYGLYQNGTPADSDMITLPITNNTVTFTMPDCDVCVEAVYYSTSPHTLTLNSVGEGTITYNGKTSAQVYAGESVTLTVTPKNKGYQLQSLFGVTANYDASTHTFIMPDRDVNISGEFIWAPPYSVHAVVNDATLGQIASGVNQETFTYTFGAKPNNKTVYMDGWYDRKTGKQITKEAIYTISPESDIDIECRFIQGYIVVLASNIKNGSLEYTPYRSLNTSYPENTCYKPGETIKLVGTPDEGYILEGYYYANLYIDDTGAMTYGETIRLEGDTLTMDHSYIILANFVKSYEVVVSTSDAKAGNVYGNGQYAQYDKAKVTAVPNEGYEFVSWTNESGSVMSTNADYEFYVYGDSYTFNLTANFRRIQKTVTWVDGDGNTLKSEKINYGEVPSYSGATPTKKSTAQYNYTFNNTWSPEITSVTENVTYTAQFNSELRKYTITWIDGNGNNLKSEQLSYGTVPSYTGTIPTKTETAQYSYTFTGWSPTIVQVTKDAIYTAQFTESTKTYDITWVDGNGKTIKVDKVAYGSTPSYSGGTPVKDATAQYTYTFTGWSPTITSVTKAATYTAQFRSTINKYKIDWVDSDGTLLKSEQVEYGSTPSYNGTPTKQATSKYSYTFSGWSPAVAQVTKNATYTACYTETPVVHTITFVSVDKGKTSVVGTISKGYGTPVTITFDDPERVGFIFTGWDTQIPQTMPDHDMTITAEWEMEPVYMTSANVEFKGLIRMRMAFLMTEELHSRDDVYVAYYKEDGTVAAKIPLKDGEYLKDQDGLKSYGYYCPVRAKEFADNLYIKVIGVDGNPVGYSLSSGSWSGTEYVYTTKMYADAVLASSLIKQTMKDVASAFLDYGAAANIRFANGSAGYSVSDKVTQVTWEEMGESASYDSDKAKAMGVKISLNLDFMEDNSLYVYFTLPNGKTVSDYTFTFKKNGTSNTVTPIAQGGNKYLVKVSNIAARKLAEFYDITITEKSNSANTFTVHVSALSYAKTLAKQYEGTTDPTKQKMLNLVKSLYLYWKAAAAHWGTN